MDEAEERVRRAEGERDAARASDAAKDVLVSEKDAQMAVLAAGKADAEARAKVRLESHSSSVEHGPTALQEDKAAAGARIDAVLGENADQAATIVRLREALERAHKSAADKDAAHAREMERAEASGAAKDARIRTLESASTEDKAVRVP